MDSSTPTNDEPIVVLELVKRWDIAYTRGWRQPEETATLGYLSSERV